MALCSICKRELPFLDLLRAPQLKQCKDCNTRLTNAKQNWMNTIEQAFSADRLSQQLEQDLYRNFQALQMPPDLGQGVVQRLQYLPGLSEIRWGNVPVIRTDIHLDSDEISHFSMLVTHHSRNRGKEKL